MRKLRIKTLRIYIALLSNRLNDAQKIDNQKPAPYYMDTGLTGAAVSLPESVITAAGIQPLRASTFPILGGRRLPIATAAELLLLNSLHHFLDLP